MSRLTIDKLGVKLYDRVSAVVAELIANSYDADAEHVTVRLPLGTQLAKANVDSTTESYTICVTDDGHGMTPEEAQQYFLAVGTDRRTRAAAGAQSREKCRPVMGRKGIGKLAPFGICRRIEVKSAGGPETDNGYLVSHFILDFETIVTDDDNDVEVETGPDDRTFQTDRGTTVTLSDFLPKLVPNKEIFSRQVARRFALAREDFTIHIEDTKPGSAIGSFDIDKFKVELNPGTRIDLAARGVPCNGESLPVSGWLAFGKEAIRNEEEAGVRIYARGKLVATTRDFELPAGFTGEFAARSYLLGEVHAEWLDKDNGDDLIRTDRQGILWDSEYGSALRDWGKDLIKEVAKLAAGPRRESMASKFMRQSRLRERAEEQYPENRAVVEAVVDLGHKIGGFAQEDELGNQEYVDDLANIVLMVGPHKALINSFKVIAGQDDTPIEQLVALFEHSRTAELASYSQIARERVDVINRLRASIDDPEADEAVFQRLIAGAPWLIRPDWTVISENQALKTFRDRFTAFWKANRGEDLEIAISMTTKRPDFTLVHLGHQLHIVELKRPTHQFDDNDYDRLENYLVAFEEFFEKHEQIRAGFPAGWQVDLVADGVSISDTTRQRAFKSDIDSRRVVSHTWDDFLFSTTIAHQQFLDVYDAATRGQDDSDGG